MKNDHPNGRENGARTSRSRSARPQATPALRDVQIDVERSGDWMPAEDLRGVALEAVAGSADVTVNLRNVDHLDASVLQILLAFEKEQRGRERTLNLVNASPQLVQCFEFAGVANHFDLTARKSHE